MTRITLNDLDKKLDLALQKLGYIESGQADHFKSDERQFQKITLAHESIVTDIALIKQNESNSRRYFSRGWTVFVNVLTALVVAFLGYFAGGRAHS